jgi:hypothetical protein
VCSSTRTWRRQSRQLQRSLLTGGTTTSGNGERTRSSLISSRPASTTITNLWTTSVGLYHVPRHQPKRSRPSCPIAAQSSRYPDLLLPSSRGHHSLYSCHPDSNEPSSSEYSLPRCLTALPERTKQNSSSDIRRYFPENDSPG